MIPKKKVLTTVIILFSFFLRTYTLTVTLKLSSSYGTYTHRTICGGKFLFLVGLIGWHTNEANDGRHNDLHHTELEKFHITIDWGGGE